MNTIKNNPSIYDLGNFFSDGNGSGGTEFGARKFSPLFS